MRCYILLAALLILCVSNSLGTIHNGYSEAVPRLRVSLARLHQMLENPFLSAADRRKIRTSMKSVINYMTCYEVTERMLHQFREIAPDLYCEIDQLKDTHGRPVDVYVKFILPGQAEFRSMGTTVFSQSREDHQRCVSVYGEGSVAVNIWIVRRALRVLSHEFGHLRYLAPNLASYVAFYKRHYRKLTFDGTFGHGSGDASGRSAYAFEHEFLRRQARFRKDRADELISPVALLTSARRNYEEKEESLMGPGESAPIEPLLQFPTFSFAPEGFDL